MEAPISPGRRTLLKAGALTLATPVIVAVAQPAGSHQEATTFDLWVISDSHVGTDKAASAGIQHGLVEGTNQHEPDEQNEAHGGQLMRYGFHDISSHQHLKAK